MTFTKLSDTLCQLKAQGIADLVLCGGEPLLRDDLLAIVCKASELKFDKIQIVTNGFLLTRERIEQLVESGITSVYISLNASESVHDITRGIKGAYAKTMDALKSLVELRDSKFPHLDITVQTIIMELTVGQIIDLAKLCLQLRVGLSLSPLNTSRPWQGAIPADLRSINQEQLDHVIQELHRIKKLSPSLIRNSHTSLEFVRGYFADSKREDIPCYLGYQKICVGPHGEVYPGCVSLPPVGDLEKASLNRIISSKAYKESIRNMFLKRCPGCSCDHILNLYSHFPSLVKEMKWRVLPV